MMPKQEDLTSFLDGFWELNKLSQDAFVVDLVVMDIELTNSFARLIDLNVSLD